MVVTGASIESAATVKPESLRLAFRRSKAGISSRHGGHHVAHTLSRITRPWKSARLLRPIDRGIQSICVFMMPVSWLRAVLANTRPSLQWASVVVTFGCLAARLDFQLQGCMEDGEVAGQHLAKRLQQCIV